MAAAREVDLAFDMTEHPVGWPNGSAEGVCHVPPAISPAMSNSLWNVSRTSYLCGLLRLNRRFAHAVRQYVRPRRDWFHDWRTQVINVSAPGLGLARTAATYQMERDYDSAAEHIPFEKDWYAMRVPAAARGSSLAIPMVTGTREGRGPTSEGRGAGELPMVLLAPWSGRRIRVDIRCKDAF